MLAAPNQEAQLMVISRISPPLGSAFLLIIIFSCTPGCAESGGPEARDKARSDEERAIRGDNVEESMGNEISSADYMLSDEDFDAFRRGRSKDDILRDLQWRGNLEMATEHKGSSVHAISYGIFGGPFGNDPRGDIIWAIFVDSKFKKFVDWPEWGEAKIKVGDFGRLIQALEKEPLDIADLRKKINTEPPPRSDVDPGLTSAWLLLRDGVEAAHERSLKKNADLRDQYNAMRLKIGMHESDVESVLRSQPILQGEVQAGTFKIYGADQVLDADRYLHYSNILTLFVNGQLIGIYSGYTVPGGYQWRQRLLESFDDLLLTKLDTKDDASNQ